MGPFESNFLTPIPEDKVEGAKNKFILDNRELGSKSYKSILTNIDRWKRGNGTTDDRLKYTDPATFFFKIFFYFDSVAGDTPASRLLGLDVDFASLTAQGIGNPNLTKGGLGFGQGLLYDGRQLISGDTGLSDGSANQVSNSAINFLLQNCEYERAEKLLQFISLLSEISTYEPWTFQQIAGLDEALTRKIFSGERDIKIDENRKAIDIACLPESYNSRIGTLMDLYRDVCYSYKWKKDIIPANLRKFDMGIYIFSQPVRRFHDNSRGGWGKFEIPSKNFKASEAQNSGYYTSVKYIELLNCEIDYNSNVKTYTDLDVSEGKNMENTLRIYFDDAYELRYNEFMMRVIGDMIFQDTDFECQEGYFQTDNNKTVDKLYRKSSKDILETENVNLNSSSGFLATVTDQKAGVLASQVSNGLNRVANAAISRGIREGSNYINERTSTLRNAVNKVKGNLQQFSLENMVRKAETTINPVINPLPRKLPNSTPPEEKRGFTRISLND